MKRFWKIAKTEFISIFKDGGAMLILFGAMLIYGTLYPLIYAPQVVRGFSVAVVDLDNTPASRKLTRMLDATPEADVRYMPLNLEEARQLFFARKVYGVLYIPQGYGKRILAGEQNHISLYADGSYFLLYSDFLSAVSEVAMSVGSDIQIEKLTAAGMTEKQAEWVSQPVPYDVNILYNPYGGYATAVMPPVLILIAQQLLLIGIGFVGGTWYEKGTWRRFRDYSAVRLTLAKATAYLFLYIPLMLYMFSFQYKFFGYPMNGNHTDLLLVFIPYLLSVIFLGLTFGALFRRRETSMMVLIVTSVFFLIVSGISWPKEGMPEWLYALGRLAPSSSGIDALVRIRTMGATLQQVAPEIITLWILTGVYGITAVVATRRRTHELHTAAEAARQERKMRELSSNNS